ncbi:phosphoribosyltransferase [Sulfolobales archaeon HS-7]|nr:phosphoribosyltransferase [Sulfolobales archaeon HS-7]
MVKIPVRVVDWDDIVNWSSGISDKIKRDEYKVDVIIAIARGGLVPARLVADALGVLDVISIKVEHWVQTANKDVEAKIKFPYKLDLKGGNVLIVDDICDTGDSLEIAKKFVSDNFNPGAIRTSTMQYIESTARIKPDYYAATITDWAWFMYPWNYWEDEINLIRKLLDNGVKTDIEHAFKDNYGVEPPIPVKDVLEEMKRRNLLNF